MYVDLTDVFASEGKEECVSAEIEMERFSCKNGDYEIVEKTPVNLIFTNLGAGEARVQGQAAVTLRMSCDRCLKPVDKEIRLNFEDTVYAPEKTGAAETDGTDGTDEPEYESDGQLCMEGYRFDVERMVNTEIAVNLPMKVLCKADCKGICRQCGKDLNAGECGCDLFVPDPRLAAIKDIFYENYTGNKEV